MILEIVSPEATLFKGEVTSVIVPGINGEFQMLNNHAAIVSLLTKGNVSSREIENVLPISGEALIFALQLLLEHNKIAINSNNQYYLL